MVIIGYMLIFWFGLCTGSFTNVIILRLHSGQKGILTGKSECPQCKQLLGFWDLIPLFSWFFLKGKCRYCQKKISIQYPLVELIMGLLWMFVTFMIPIGINSSIMEWAEFLLILLVASCLFVITVYDLKYMEIPDEISLPLIGMLLLSLTLPFTPHWIDGLLGAGILIGFFIGLYYLGIWLFRKEGIGGGDLRLGAIMGLLLGWKMSVVALFLSCLLGAAIGILFILIGKKEWNSLIPFGPYLSFATVITFFWGEDLLEVYLRFSGLR